MSQRPDFFCGKDALHYEAPTWTAENCTFEEGRPEKDEKSTKRLKKRNTRWWFQISFDVHPEPWGNDPI